jgi:hypothetical protein
LPDLTIATTGIGLNIYRLVTGFGYQMDVKGPLVYLHDLSHWEGLAAPILLGIVIWIGDALVVSEHNRPETVSYFMHDSVVDISLLPDLGRKLHSYRRPRSFIPRQYM